MCAQIRKQFFVCLFVLNQQATQYSYMSLVGMAEAWLRAGIKVLAHTEGWFARNLPVFRHVSYKGTWLEAMQLQALNHWGNGTWSAEDRERLSTKQNKITCLPYFS